MNSQISWKCDTYHNIFYINLLISKLKYQKNWNTHAMRVMCSHWFLNDASDLVALRWLCDYLMVPFSTVSYRHWEPHTDFLLTTYHGLSQSKQCRKQVFGLISAAYLHCMSYYLSKVFVMTGTVTATYISSCRHGQNNTAPNMPVPCQHPIVIVDRHL